MGVSTNNQTVVHPIHTDRCNCVDHIFTPVRSKMKVLKKIKKRMGLTPKSCSLGSNNLPPVFFHQVHGENIRLSSDGAIARRVESFCKGVALSNRPIKIQEKVFVKFLDVSNNWSGVLRFGFSSSDPNSLRYSLPKYACPDLTNKPGHWAKALAERFAEKDTVLFFYVTSSGDVHFGINGEDKGIFFSGVDTRGPLWALFDIYGNSTGIELLPHRGQMNNCRRSADLDGTTLISRFDSLNINSPTHLSNQGREAVLDVRHHQPEPLFFHKTRGRNIRVSNDRCMATRSDTEFCHGYVFTARPIRLDEKIIVQVLATESMFVGAIAFGLTSCDPSSLNMSDLPEDADSLLDRREYWVVNKDVANSPQKGDELVFCVTSAGEVTLSKNRGPANVFMHVDETLQLWPFFDVYGSTQKIRLVGTIPPTATPRPELANVNRVRVNMTTTDYRHCCVPTSSTPAPTPAPTTASAELLQVQQIQPTMGGGTVLVVNLPPAQSNFINQQTTRIATVPMTHPHSLSHSHTHSHHHGHATHSTAHASHSHSPITTVHHPDRSTTLSSNYSNNYIEPISSGSGYSTLENGNGVVVPTPWLESAHLQAGGGVNGSLGECSICYERTIDSVLYMCGHMCMCYECAVQQWRGKGGGHCPLCRAVIRDVIRTYKS